MNGSKRQNAALYLSVHRHGAKCGRQWAGSAGFVYKVLGLAYHAIKARHGRKSAIGAGVLTTPKSAAQLVYDQLKKKIIDFEIYPGTRITESEIAEDFQVSRTPVRAALQRLETEGQITIMP